MASIYMGTGNRLTINFIRNVGILGWIIFDLSKCHFSLRPTATLEAYSYYKILLAYRDPLSQHEDLY